ncbi:MAG: PD-(D/E)XK nuclease family protein, partial [Bacteroidetes bacterium]|nr:PD-(D/E)XK nuclease family protein [Bacteroidota bacterium]
FLTPDRFKRLNEHGSKILTDYFNQNKNNWQNIIYQELGVYNHEKEGVNLSGKIDRIDNSENGLVVYDYKTSKYDYQKKKLFQSPSAENLVGGEYWRQLVFYKLLMDLRNSKEVPIAGSIIFLEREKGDVEFKEEKIHFTTNDTEKLFEIILTYVNKLKNYEIESCGECAWCEFTGKIKNTLFD